jgi:hypothetical protein
VFNLHLFAFQTSNIWGSLNLSVVLNTSLTKAAVAWMFSCRAWSQSILIFSWQPAELFLQPASCCFLPCLTLRRVLWRRYFSPKHRSTFTRLHGVIPQKTVLFIVAAVRTSNPSQIFCCTIYFEWHYWIKCFCKQEEASVSKYISWVQYLNG